MKNQIEVFNANRNALVIPANISQIVNMKELDGKTFEGGAISFYSFKMFAEKMGVIKPAKGEDRTHWNECKAIYNNAKLTASRWVRENAIRACADEKLLGKKMSMKVYKTKDGFTRREVSFTLADQTKSESKVKTVRLTTREQVEAAAAQLGLKLVDAEQGELSLA
jgi:hypothetical protein